MENDNKELKEETTKKEADKKETESKEETKQPVEETAVQKKKSKKWIGIVAAVVAVFYWHMVVWQFTTSLIS